MLQKQKIGIKNIEIKLTLKSSICVQFSAYIDEKPVYSQ